MKPDEKSKEYQKTLNLPKTDFSMRAGLVNKEPALLEKWIKEDLYAAIREKSEGQKQFTLHDGPPYANGDIHIGHALNKILKDFIVKSKTMQGYDSLYIPGWDCHGLPIEHQLLKKLKKHKSQIDCLDLRKQAHDYALSFVNVQKEQFKRLGIFGEWEKPYLTLDPQYESWILKSLSALNEKGYIYRGLKPVNWCFSCETALAEAEVEHEDHTSPSVYVKFEIEDQGDLKDVFAGRKASLLVWTTTPWTLMANVAVAVAPNFNYALVQIEDEILIVESTLLSSVCEKGGVSDYKILKEVEGTELTALTYKHPFALKDKCRVVCADYVTKEDGTGLVHTAPGHGQDDFETGLKNNLDVLMPVNNRGVYTEDAGSYAGQHVFKANPLIIEDLKSRGVLFASEDIAHSYPHCWRCKKPIIFRATKQWFLKIDHENLRGRLKEVITQDVKFVPPSGIERILGMVTGRPDWCLSRQRYWGVPIPAIACEGCKGEHKLDKNVIEHFAKMVETEGTDAWYEKDIKALLPEGFKCPDCGGTTFEKTFDILDVWFDSGVSHQAVMKARLGKELPVDLYLEGSDQHRGWFQSSLIPAVGLENKAPYKEILTHGFVVDGNGRKMSKSMGNVVSPLDVMKNSGADILRLWVAASSYNEDIRVSKEILDRLVDAYRKIRNTVRYLLGNLNGFDPNTDLVEYKDLLDLDKWALCQLSKVSNDVVVKFNDYEFAKVYKSIYNFCNEELSSFYLDILKDRLYTSATKSGERLSAQTVLYHILNHLVRLMAPILSFTADEIFTAMPKDDATALVKSIHVLDWLQVPEEWKNTEIEEKFQTLVDLRPFVLKALEDKRRVGDIGSSLEAKVIFQSASAKDLEFFNKNEEFLPSAFIVSQVEVVSVDSISQGLSEDFKETQIEIEKASGDKCSRCWNYFDVLGSDSSHATLCTRCTAIVKEFE
ncbi:isoleucine--tRNA ligase [Candidatus Omnitrophota bacterium]